MKTDRFYTVAFESGGEYHTSNIIDAMSVLSAMGNGASGSLVHWEKEYFGEEKEVVYRLHTGNEYVWVDENKNILTETEVFRLMMKTRRVTDENNQH